MVLEHLLLATEHILQEVNIGLTERRQVKLALSSQDLIEILLAVHSSSQLITMDSHWLLLLLLMTMMLLQIKLHLIDATIGRCCVVCECGRCVVVAAAADLLVLVLW